MSYLNPTNAHRHVKPHAPFSAIAKDVSEWFKNEFLELTFGESVGRPSASFVMRKEYIARFLENGWTVDAVSESVEGGVWKSVSSSRKESYGSGHSNSSLTSSSSGNSIRNDSNTTASEQENSSSSENKRTNDSNSSGSENSSSSSSSKTRTEDLRKKTDTTENASVTNDSSSSSNTSITSKTDASTSGNTTDSRNTSGTANQKTDSSSEDRYSSDVSSVSDSSSAKTSLQKTREEDASTSTSDTSGSSSSESETESNESHYANSTERKSGSESSRTEQDDTASESAAYWAVYHRIRMRRRRMVPEAVLQTMVDTFTDSYNTGHANDEARYEEVIAVYSAVMSSTEREMDSLVSGGVSLDGLYDMMSSSFMSSVRAAEESARKVGDAALAEAIDEISRKFDAVLAKARSELVSSGLFNGTVWISTSAGIERQKSAAIVSARADAAKAGADANVAVVSAKNTAYSALADVMKTMAELVDKRRTTATEMRNTVAKWLADAVASKKEDMPQIEEFAQLVQTFGFSVGASGNVL